MCERDLNTSKALAVVWEAVRSDLDSATKRATLAVFDSVLGLDLAGWAPKAAQVPQEVLDLVQARAEARREKRWADADSLRDQVTELGFVIKDTPDGATVERL